MKKPAFKIVVLLLVMVCLSSEKIYSQANFATDYFKITINNKGFISSMKNIL